MELIQSCRPDDWHQPTRNGTTLAIDDCIKYWFTEYESVVLMRTSILMEIFSLVEKPGDGGRT